MAIGFITKVDMVNEPMFVSDSVGMAHRIPGKTRMTIEIEITDGHREIADMYQGGALAVTIGAISGTVSTVGAPTALSENKPAREMVAEW